MSVQNMQFRPSYLAVSITVTNTRQKLSAIIETMLGPAAGQLAQSWREVQLQVDPETSSGATVRIGNGNLGDVKNTVTQKGISLLGQSDTYRSVFNNVDISLMWVMTTTGTAVLNCQLFAF